MGRAGNPGTTDSRLLGATNRWVGARVGAVLVLVGGVTTGCLTSPTDADPDEFCAAAHRLFAFADEEEFESARDDLADVGTPPQITGEERKGFRHLVDVEWDERDNGRGDGEKMAITAFVEAYRSMCGVTGGQTN